MENLFDNWWHHIGNLFGYRMVAKDKRHMESSCLIIKIVRRKWTLWTMKFVVRSMIRNIMTNKSWFCDLGLKCDIEYWEANLLIWKVFLWIMYNLAAFGLYRSMDCVKASEVVLFLEIHHQCRMLHSGLSLPAYFTSRRMDLVSDSEYPTLAPPWWNM